MVCDGEMEHSPPTVVEDKENPQVMEGGGGHGETVHPRQTVPVVAQKGHPALESLWGRGPILEVTRDGAFIDSNAKLQEFPMDPGCSPTIVPGHLPDELSKLGWNAGTADPFGFGFQPPEPPEPLALPAHHRVGLDQEKDTGPTWSSLAQQHPEEAINGV